MNIYLHNFTRFHAHLCGYICVLVYIIFFFAYQLCNCCIYIYKRTISWWLLVLINRQADLFFQSSAPVCRGVHTHTHAHICTQVHFAIQLTCVLLSSDKQSICVNSFNSILFFFIQHFSPNSQAHNFAFISIMMCCVSISSIVQFIMHIWRLVNLQLPNHLLLFTCHLLH